MPYFERMARELLPQLFMHGADPESHYRHDSILVAAALREAYEAGRKYGGF